MARNWTTPRKKLLEIAVELVVNRGCTVDGVADTMSRSYFRGIDRARALRRFQRDLEPLVTAGFRAKFDAEYAELKRKETELIAEGWRWVSWQGEGFFVHDRFGYEVNKGGGVWPTREQAILETWNSVSRQKVLEHLERQRKQETPHV